MKTKQTKSLDEFQKEFKRNLLLTAMLKVVTIIMMFWLLLLLAAFTMDLAQFFKPLIGGLFILLALLIPVLIKAKQIHHFGMGKTKILKKLEQDIHDWREGIKYLGFIKTLKKEDYERHYLIKDHENMSVAFEDIQARMDIYTSNIEVTGQKITYLNTQTEKTTWQYITSWEWLKAV